MNIILLIAFCIITFLFVLIHKLRSLIYNIILSPYTTLLYKKFLEEVKPNTIGLDIGIGTGKSLINNKDIIIKKHIKLIGYDTDSGYVEQCRTTITDKQLDNHITVKNKDITKINSLNDKVDFILFSDSYNVIKDVHKMINHCIKFLKYDGSIYIITTLDNSKDYTIKYKRFIKPKLKFFCSVDFGRVTTTNEFKSKVINDGWTIKNFKVIYNHTFPLYGTVKTYLIELKYNNLDSDYIIN